MKLLSLLLVGFFVRHVTETIELKKDLTVKVQDFHFINTNTVLAFADGKLYFLLVIVIWRLWFMFGFKHVYDITWTIFQSNLEKDPQKKKNVDPQRHGGECT